MSFLRQVHPFLVSVVICLASVVAQQQGQVNVADNSDRKIFDSSTANKTYMITNNGPDTSIKIWRKHAGSWEVIAILGAGESHSVTPTAGDQLAAEDPNDADLDSATVSWTIA